MAVRVHKLAKELRASPAAILQALEDLGYAKYRSPQDMLPSPAAQKVREMARKMGLPEAKLDGAVGAPVRKKPEVRSNKVSLDTPIERASSVSRARTGGGDPDLLFRIGELERELHTANGVIRAKDEAIRELEAKLAALTSLNASQEDRATKLRAELDHSNARLESLQGRSMSIQEVLQGHGLWKAEEWKSALNQLLELNDGDIILTNLRTLEPSRMHQWVGDRLRLVAGAWPARDGLATVVVDESRAVWPAYDRLKQWQVMLSDELLLMGVTQVAFEVPGEHARLWREVIQGFDTRIRASLAIAGSNLETVGTGVELLIRIVTEEHGADALSKGSSEVLVVVHQTTDGTIRAIVDKMRDN